MDSCLNWCVGLFTAGVALTTLKNHKPRIKVKESEECDQTVVIVGCGFSGLCTAIKLKERGIPFVIFEKKNEIGGTWLDNIYPGSGCDVPSYLYSFSFEPGYWSRKWASQKEILQYIQDTARKYDIYSHTQFNCEVTEADFDENKLLWNIKTSSGKKSGGLIHY